MTKENKAVVRRMFEEVWNKRNIDVLDEIFAPYFVSHTLPRGVELPAGVEGVRQWVRMYQNAFPDTRFTLEAQVAEGDLVVSRWSSLGTHKGELMGIPATGKQATLTGIVIHRLRDGRIVEAWGHSDQLGVMQQLGVVPEMSR